MLPSTELEFCLISTSLPHSQSNSTETKTDEPVKVQSQKSNEKKRERTVGES